MPLNIIFGTSTNPDHHAPECVFVQWHTLINLLSLSQHAYHAFVKTFVEHWQI